MLIFDVMYVKIDATLLKSEEMKKNKKNTNIVRVGIAIFKMNCGLHVHVL